MNADAIYFNRENWRQRGLGGKKKSKVLFRHIISGMFMRHSSGDVKRATEYRSLNSKEKFTLEFKM